MTDCKLDPACRPGFDLPNFAKKVGTNLGIPFGAVQTKPTDTMNNVSVYVRNETL